MAWDLLNRAYTIGTIDGAQDITPGTAQTGFRDFSTMPNSDKTRIVAVQGASWSYMTALKVGTVLRPQTYHDGSSGEGNSVTFSAGTISVFSDIGWQHLVYNDHNGVAQNAEGVLKSFSPETLVDLKTTTPLPATGKTICFLRGILAGDKKGAIYVWESAEATAGDDFNYVVSSLSATGRWVRQKLILELPVLSADSDAYSGGTYKVGSEIRDKSSTGVVKKIPRLERWHQGEFITFAEWKALASSKWTTGDTFVFRGVTAENDLGGERLTYAWDASNTDTASLDSISIRPDDISGSNPGRALLVEPGAMTKFTNSDATPSLKAARFHRCADTVPAAITALDDMVDLRVYWIFPGAQDQVFTHSGTLKCPEGADYTLKTTGSPIMAVSDNGVVSLVAGGISATKLASTSNGEGASLVGIEDAAGNYSGSTVEAAFTYLGGLTKRYRNVYADIYGVVGASTIAGATAMDTELDAAISKIHTDKGGTLVLPGGVIRLSAQHTFDISGMHVVGQGRTGLTGADEGTTLDLRYNSGPPLIFGNGATQRRDMSMRSLHLEGANGATSVAAIRSRYVRGFTLDDLSFGGIFSLLECGQSGEPTSFVHLGDMEGNLPATHGHFVDFINAPGPIWIADGLHVEGVYAAAKNCFNWGAAAVASDGVQIGQCTVRKFDRLLNIRPGWANFILTGAILDYYKEYGIYADTDVGTGNKLIAVGCQINCDPSHVGSLSIGVYISRSTSNAYDVCLTGNQFLQAGGPAVWLTGAMPVAVVGNIARECCQAADATYNTFRYGSAVTGAAIGNRSISTTANSPNNGHLFEGDANGTDFYMDEKSNTSTGHVTNAVSYTTFPRRPTAVVLRIKNNAGTIQHSFVSVSRDDSIPIGNFGAAIQNISSSWTNSPTGTDASTAMAAGGKIATAIGNAFALDTADLVNNSDHIQARINPIKTTATAMTGVYVQNTSWSVNGVTRTRPTVIFNAAINTTNITASQEVWVELTGQMKGYS